MGNPTTHTTRYYTTIMMAFDGGAEATMQRTRHGGTVAMYAGSRARAIVGLPASRRIFFDRGLLTPTLTATI